MQLEVQYALKRQVIPDILLGSCTLSAKVSSCCEPNAPLFTCRCSFSLTGRPVGASVFIKTGDSMVPLSGKWKSPAGWSFDIYDSAKVQRALTDRPHEVSLDSGDLSMNFSGALRLGALRPALLPPGAAPAGSALVLQVALLNDGQVAWRRGAEICQAGGNASMGFTGFCLKNWEMSTSCEEVLVGELVELYITIPLPAEQDVNGLQQSKFSLCDLSKKPFGIVMSFHFYFERIRSPVSLAIKMESGRRLLSC